MNPSVARPTRTLIGLILILLVEAAIFLPSFGKFYCGDSLYWFSRLLDSGDDLVRQFSTTDDLGQYRPFTFVFYSFIVHPLAGLDLQRQHLFPLFFHGLNTVLVFLLGRRIFSEWWKALLSGFFFGVSNIAAYITYDNTFIPDYLYVFFFLAALYFLTHKRLEESGLHIILTSLIFLPALFSKEAGVTFPAAAFLLIVLLESQEGEEGGRQQGTGGRRAFLRSLPFGLMALVYIGWHLVLKHGSLYPADPNQPHHLELSLVNLRAKIPIFLQAFGLPLPSDGGKIGGIRAAAVAVVLPLFCWMCVCIARGLYKRRPVHVLGLLWVIVTSAPALLIVANSWEQNLYLPLVGLSWIFAESIAEGMAITMRAGMGTHWKRGVPVFAVLGGVFATAVHASAVRDQSWMSMGSTITWNCLSDLKRMHPHIASNTLIYVETRENPAWHFDSGRMAATFYHDPSIRMRFSHDGRPGPSARMLRTGKVIVLKYLDGHFFDITARRRLESTYPSAYPKCDTWDRAELIRLQSLNSRLLEREVPQQPIDIELIPRSIKRGGSVLVQVAGGEDMELDCQYLLNSQRIPKTVNSWLTTDPMGRSTLTVNTPGHYVITAIRNSLRSDWIPVHHEWDCLP